MNRSLRLYRLLAFTLSIAVLGWQCINLGLGLGRFWHEYILVDVIASLFLLSAASRRSAVGMLAGFAMFAGIFLAATTSKLIVSRFHPGTIAAAVGVVWCAAGAIGLGRRMKSS